MRAPSISPAPIIFRSFNGSIRTTSLRLAALQRSDARLTSRRYEAHFSLSRPATTRLLLPNSCWPPDIWLVVRSVKSARRSWLVHISGCSWEQPPSYVLGPRPRAGSRRPDMVDDAPPTEVAWPAVVSSVPYPCQLFRTALHGRSRQELSGDRSDVSDRAAARAASGQAAAPPSSVMNARRFMTDMGLVPPHAVGLPHTQPTTERSAR